MDDEGPNNMIKHLRIGDWRASLEEGGLEKPKNQRGAKNERRNKPKTDERRNQTKKKWKNKAVIDLLFRWLWLAVIYTHGQFDGEQR